MSYYKFTSILLKSLIVLWIIVLAVALQLLAGYYFSDSSMPLLFFVIGLVFGTISGAYFYVILSVPYLLVKEFDSIKNRVALGEFESVDDFQKKVAQFLIKFFRFPGMTATGGRFCFKGCNILTISSKADYSKIRLDRKEIKFVKEKNFTVFAIPINVGDNNLGEFYLEINTIFPKHFKNLIGDFENYLLDDLLLIVMLLNDRKK